MTVLEKQNETHFQDLLCAQRYYYDVARMYRRIRSFISVLIPALSLFLGLYYPSVKGVMAVLGPLWLGGSHYLLQETEKRYTKIAATIQEDFDTRLFGIEWSKLLVGDRIKPELIHAAVANFKGDREKLKDWYKGLNCKTDYLNTLLAQRTNLIWDQHLRRSYAQIIKVFTVAYLIVTAIYGLYTGMSLQEYVVAVFLPSLSMIVFGFENARSHHLRADRCERVEKDVTAAFEWARDRPESENNSNPQLCREFQNHIFMSRSEPTLIASWWYWKKQKSYNETMARVNQALCYEEDALN